MAQQTINVGAAPNDGTGTPLRTAFQYTNSNFSELYTAVGPSGNNIVVPGSATITGDLTVDTSTLKVDSANNRVGIGTATPADTLDVNGRVTALRYLSSSSNASLPSFAVAAGNGIYNSGANEIGFSINSTSAMTLNSTGLGIGTASPAFKLDVAGGAGSGVRYTGNSVQNVLGETGGLGLVGTLSNHSLGLYTNASLKATIDSSGNVGIGVTPKSWASGYRALQLGIYSALTDAAGGATYLTNNAYFDSVDSRWEHITNNRAVRYDQNTADGGHKWYSAGSGAANAAIAWGNPLMTLDASGNLLVGTTTAGAKITALAGASGQAAIFEQPAQNFWCVLAYNKATSGDNSFVLFGTEASFTSRGSITYNRGGGLVAYNTTSDYRSKDIIGPVSNSGSLIDSLKVYVGKMKGATIERPMLIAHEAQEVAPYAVTGTKDELDTDGNPKYQQMDVSALVPVLIAEIQSLRARVQTLEAK